LRIWWGVSFASPIFFAVLMGSASDLTGTGTSSKDEFANVVMLSILAMIVMSIVLGYLTWGARSWARQVGWWLVTAFISAAAGFALASPWLRTSKMWEPGGIEGSGDLTSVSIRVQLHDLEWLTLALAGLALLGGLLGLCLTLVVHFIRRHLRRRGPQTA
jgi:NhaP-type Na+/H+ or K+/H+ antiporter